MSDRLIRDFEAKMGPPTETGCQEWQGSLNRQGYGLFWRGPDRYAHRHSYRLHKGVIPRGKIVQHRCDNKKCVNPAHLILGTRRDNAKDALERGRYASGSSRRPDLNNDRIFQARVDYHKLGVSRGTVSEDLGMCLSQTSDTVWGRLWRDAPMPAGVRRKARRRKLKRDRRKDK